MPEYPGDSLREWADYYLEMAVTGIRSDAVTHKIRFHLARFQAFFEERYGQENISSFVKRDVIAWREHLRSAGLAAFTINNHMASLSGFATWVQAQDATAFVMGDPDKGHWRPASTAARTSRARRRPGSVVEESMRSSLPILSLKESQVAAIG